MRKPFKMSKMGSGLLLKKRIYFKENKFVPTSNTLGGDAETRTVLQCDMVQNMPAIQGM